MIRWLQDNPVGLALAALCGVLLLVMLVIALAALLPVRSGVDAEDALAGGEALNLPELGESPPIDNYYVITERPLFNESRQPVRVEELEVDPLADAMQEGDDDAPEVELSGVVITPSLRMATLRMKAANRSLVAFEGRPIEGDLGSWQLSRVDAREVVLTSGSGDELLLKLKVHDEKIAPPERPAPAPRAETAEAPDDEARQAAEGRQLSRAEEIRQRIAERREELRRQAEMEEQAAEESAQPDYRDAIQSMIGRNRRNNSDNLDEQ